MPLTPVNNYGPGFSFGNNIVLNPVDSVALLNSGYPPAMYIPGTVAPVGAAEPYAIYICDGQTWSNSNLAAANSFFSATGGGSGLVADGVPAPWAVALHSDLTHGVNTDNGPQPVFARDSSGSGLVYVTDDQGLMRQTLTGEACSFGLRREYNLCRFTEQLNFTGTNGWAPINGAAVAPIWNDTLPAPFYGRGDTGGTVWRVTADTQINSVLRSLSTYVLEAVPHVFAVKLRADIPHAAEIRVYVSAGATHTRVVAVTTAWQWFYVPFTPDGTSAYVYSVAGASWASTGGGVVDVAQPQMHQRVGVTTAPPEYVSRDAYPVGRYWFGAGVDGLAYFDTTNANTLNAGTGVVTAVSGASLRDVLSVSTDMTTWIRTGAFATQTGFADSAGNLTAFGLVEDASPSAVHHLSTSVPSSRLYGKRRVIVRVEAKQAGRSWIRVFLNDVDNATTHFTYVNLATGALGTTTQGDFARVESLANGWYRITLIVHLTTGASNAFVRLYSVTADNTPTHNGSSAVGVYLAKPLAEVWAGFGAATFPSYQQFVDTRWANWTLPGLSAVTAGQVGPDGKTSAVRLVEDSATSTHYISTPLVGTSTYDNKWVVLSVAVKRDGALGRAWARLALADLDGTSVKSAYVSTATGQPGTVDAGMYLEVEPMGNGWFRAMLSVQIGAGASDAAFRIYCAASDAIPSYLGDGANGILVAFPNATGALTVGGSDRAVPMLYADNNTIGPINIPGQFLAYNVNGLVGSTDFGVTSKVTTYYTPGRAKKGGESQNYSAVTYIRCGAPLFTINTVGDFDTVRTGLTIRPNGQNTAHYSKWAFDLYAGNPNKNFFWRASTAYALGAIVIRLDTEPDNDNARKMFTCVIAGTSGVSEPTWNSTYTAVPDTSSNLTTDGTVRWQVNQDNGISGNWEPYLGAHQTPEDNTFMATLGCGWWLTSTNYGCYINGIENTKQTVPQLLSGVSTILPYPAKTLWLGQFGSTKGLPGEAQGGAPSSSELMPVYTMFHRDLTLWNTSPTPGVVQATTV